MFELRIFMHALQMFLLILGLIRELRHSNELFINAFCFSSYLHFAFFVFLQH